VSFSVLFKDIRFWIILFFVIRLYGITNAPLEVEHNWRQTTVAMAARNYLEVDNNVLYPRIDIAGEKTGITGMEFPLLNYMMYTVSEVFGYQHWYGRLINLLISSLGLWFFYKLVRKYFTDQEAFYATIILAASIWFQFSRKIMPDTFSMSLIIASIYYGSNYLEALQGKRKLLHLIAYFVLFVLGTLAKLPSAYIMVVMAFFVLDKRIELQPKLILSVVTGIGLIPVVFWYYYWVPQLVSTYGFWHFFMGKSIGQGVSEIIEHYPQTLQRFYDTALKFIGFAVFLFGLGYAIKKNEKKVVFLFLLTLASFCVIIVKSGFTFPHHNYYIIPFVPVMALVAGYGLAKVPNLKIASILLFAIVVEGIANQQHDFRIREDDKFLVTIEQELDEVSDRNDLILINSGEYPTSMYFTHRKGWIDYNEKVSDENYVSELKNKGLKYILIMKKRFGTEIDLQQYDIVLENENYRLYKL
jgi:4-amino-4-deoxy-L-arabinose transferase-like glycosyltransferase